VVFPCTARDVVSNRNYVTIFSRSLRNSNTVLLNVKFLNWKPVYVIGSLPIGTVFSTL